MSRQNNQWYYAVAGRAEGPVSSAALGAMRRAGRLTDKTSVWCDALDNWTTLGHAIGGEEDSAGRAQAVVGRRVPRELQQIDLFGSGEAVAA